jgi:hypothetical protein
MAHHINLLYTEKDRNISVQTLGKSSKEMLELSNLFSFVPFPNSRVCSIKTAKAAPISHCFEHGPKDANRAW